MTNQERQYLTAVTICGGIITLIDMNGNLVYYRQRGIGKIPERERHILISYGLLQRNWEQFKELPRYISISYEDPSIMGRARASYPNPHELINAVQSKSRKIQLNNRQKQSNQQCKSIKATRKNSTSRF